MIYKAEVITNTTYKKYFGTSGEFKSRYNNQTQSFRHMSHINDTELSKCLWMLKASGKMDYNGLKLPSKMDYKMVRIPI